MRIMIGFTLIELIIVISIVGILSAVAFERYTSDAVASLPSMARRLAADIRRVQTLAINTSQRLCLRVDASHNLYYSSKTLNGVCLPRDTGWAGDFQVTLDSRVSVDHSVDIVFTGIGEATSAVSVSLTSGSGNSTVTVDAVTGRVSP